MKKYISKIFYSMVVIALFIFNRAIVLADSGLDSNYESSDPGTGSIINAVFSLFSPLCQLLAEQPGSEDYNACHIIVAIISIVIFCSVTLVYMFKIDFRKTKKSIIKWAIGLIATIIFSIICFVTKLQLIVYVFILIIYIIPFIIISKKIIKKKTQRYIAEAKEIDKDFSEDKFSEEAFSIYNKVQLAWMNFKLDEVKNLLSEDMYNQYQKQLEELKEKNQKNIMDQIEYKSNKIVDINIIDGIETIKCHMDVTCHDYIIDDKEKVIKGKKDAKYNYVYELDFMKNLSDNKYILIKKKMKKIKIGR